MFKQCLKKKDDLVCGGTPKWHIKVGLYSETYAISYGAQWMWRMCEKYSP